MSLPHSGHRMSSLSVRKPRPTRDTEHFLQLKQSLCHCRSSKEMYLLPPRPKIRHLLTFFKLVIFIMLWHFLSKVFVIPLRLQKVHVYTHTTDWRSAGRTLLGIQVTETVETVGKVITRCKALARELLLAAGAQETVLVPWLVMVGHASSGDGLERKRAHISVCIPEKLSRVPACARLHMK